MTLEDEPAFTQAPRPDPLYVSSDPTLPEKIGRLANEQPYGV